MANVTLNPMVALTERADSLREALKSSIAAIQEDYEVTNDTAAAIFITSRILTFKDLYNDKGNLTDPDALLTFLETETFPPIQIMAREFFQYFFSSEMEPTEANQAKLWGLLKFCVELGYAGKTDFINQIQEGRPLCIWPDNQADWVDTFLHYLKTSDVSHRQELIDLGSSTIRKTEAFKPLTALEVTSPLPTPPLLDRVSIWIFSDYNCDPDTVLKVIAFVPTMVFLAVAYPVIAMIDYCITPTK